MITAIIELVIRFRWLVGCLVVALVGLSVYALRNVALDAIPDISDPQIIVYAKWPRSPLLIETEVTEPVVRALQGSPDVRSVRGTSHMGYSFVYVILQDPSRRAIVRQFVQDRLNAIRAQLPPDANVTVGPNASSMGWIFQYALVDHEQTRDLRELRLLNESQIKPALQSAPGVAEVASVGGLEKQYQVKLFPPLLSERGISLKQVLGAVQGAFQEAGGRTIEVTNREYQLRGSLDSGSLEKLEFLVLGRDRAGEAVRLKDVGYLQSGYDLRRGIADLDGTGEVVGGIAIMEQGRNVLAVTNALRDQARRAQADAASGDRAGPDLRSRRADLGHADELRAGARLRADRRHPRHRRRAQERRARRSRRSACCSSARSSPRCRSRCSARPSTCFRSPAWPSRLARWPTRPLSSSRTSRRRWREAADCRRPRR